MPGYDYNVVSFPFNWWHVRRVRISICAVPKAKVAITSKIEEKSSHSLQRRRIEQNELDFHLHGSVMQAIFEIRCNASLVVDQWSLVCLRRHAKHE